MITLRQLNPKDWKHLSENAHMAGFQEVKDREKERIDYALLAIHEEANSVAAYVTCKELDSENLYFQYGASVGDYRGSHIAGDSWCSFLEWTSHRYKRVSMLIENDNDKMLKMAFRSGLRVYGIRFFKKWILLEHAITFSEE